MSRSDLPAGGNPGETKAPAASGPAAGNNTNGNASAHASCQTGPASEQAASQQAEQPQGGSARVNRAEEMVDHLAAGVANFTSVWGRRIMRVGSRIREEAQDIWAEAQSIRRGDQQ